MLRSVIVRCLGKVGTDDVQYDCRACGERWRERWLGAEYAGPEWYGERGADYSRLVQLWVNSDMSYRVFSDSLSAMGASDLCYSPDEMHAIQTPDTMLAAIDAARAYAWPEEYAAWCAKLHEEQDKRDRAYFQKDFTH